MEFDKKCVKLLLNNKRSIVSDIILYDEASGDEDMVMIEITIDEQKINIISENFFAALLVLREKLEKNNIQIVCNGAAKNIYPSPMQISMGSGRKAYKLFKGQQAKNSDVVDIFDCDEDLDFVNMDEQSNYYAGWLQSVMG